MRLSLFWTAPFVSALAGYYVMRLLISTPTIQAPLVCGIPLESACALLSKCNIPLHIIHYKNDTDVPHNTVIGQTPSAGQTMRSGQTIFLTLSQKPKAPKVPNFYQKQKDAINAACSPLDIKPQYYPLTLDFCKHQCYAQYPAAHSTFNHHAMILYTAADQSAPVIWPNFVGKPLEEVLQFLATYAITPHISYADEVDNNNRSNAQTFVIDQRPLAGSIIELKDDKKPIVQFKVNL